MYIAKLYRRLFHPRYAALNRIEIIKNNILHNLSYLQSLQPHASLFPVLKSNAYGHGLRQMCEILETTNVPMVVVDSFPEAQIVYHYSSKKVLLLGEASPATYRYCDPKRTEFVIYNVHTLQRLCDTFKKPRVHLFLNTGMNREGMQNLTEFIRLSSFMLRKVEVTGFCSHLASADIDSKLNQIQSERFYEALHVLHRYGIYPQHVHLGNSAGVFILHNRQLTAFRPGIALYGYSPLSIDHQQHQKVIPLRPALRVLSTIISYQRVKKGDSVSYAETYIAKKDITAGVVPFGYFEGLDRRWSSKGVMYIKEQQCPIIGPICMNLTCLDISNTDAQIGDIVEVVSPLVQHKNSILCMATRQKTIPYEVLVRFYMGIRRIVIAS